MKNGLALLILFAVVGCAAGETKPTIKALPTAFPVDDSLVYEAPGGIYFKKYKSSRTYQDGLNIFHTNERLISPSQEFNAALSLQGDMVVYRNPSMTPDHSGAYAYYVVPAQGSSPWPPSPITYLIVTKGCKFDFGQRLGNGGSNDGRYVFRQRLAPIPADCFMTLNDYGALEIHWGKDPTDDQALVHVLAPPNKNIPGQCFCREVDLNCRAPIIAKPTALTCGWSECSALCESRCVGYRNGSGPQCAMGNQGLNLQ